MSETTSRKLLIENNKLIPEIFGIQDLNLKLIEKKFNVRITTRENQINIKGHPDSVDAVDRLLTQLQELYNGEGSLHNGDVKFAIRLMAEDATANLKSIFSERITVSPARFFHESGFTDCVPDIVRQGLPLLS